MRIRSVVVVLLAACSACATGPRPLRVYRNPDRNYFEARKAYSHYDYAGAGRLLDAAFAGGYRASSWDLVMRAGAFEATHDWAGCEAWIRAYALPRSPGFAPLVEHRALCLSHLPGQHEEAERQARVALQLEPRSCLAGFVLDHSREQLTRCRGW